MWRIAIAGVMMSLAAVAAELPASITFDRNVLPILQKNCQSCHRPGHIAPMSFLDYPSTRPWAKAIKAAVLSRKMPPWSADPRYGRFLNDPSLKQSDIEILAAWADGGAPEGDARDKPAPVEWNDGWTIQPDAVVSMLAPFPVPAKGVLELTEFTIRNCFKKDTWVTAIEILPGNKSVVHHALLLVVPHKRGVKYGAPRAKTIKRDAEGVAVEGVPKDDRLRSLVGIEAIYDPGTAPVNYGLHGGAKLIPGAPIW